MEAAPMAPPPVVEPALTAPPAPTLPPASTAIAPSQPPLKIETPNKSTIKFGLLLQPQYQAASSATALNSYSQNLYIRRARILVGGTLFGVIDYFFDTDYPNLFLPNVNTAPAGTMPEVLAKNTPGMNIQDAFATYKPLGDMLKVDVGYMLPPLSHNAIQGATTLYSWDYFAYTFQSGALFGSSASPVGRDTGVELRGLLVNGHIEYRAGLFQGLRNQATATDVGQKNFFRFAGRVQVNLLDPEPGFFYAGTYLGAKKILSIGGSVDVQDAFKSFDGDAFLDMPMGPGVLTAQVDVAHWDGGTFIPALVKQTAFMSEVGFNFAGALVSPIFQYQQLWTTPSADNTYRVGGGLAFWPFGHNSNLKAFYTYIHPDNEVRAANQINVQWQVFFF
jgi:hypothetical protein